MLKLWFSLSVLFMCQNAHAQNYSAALIPPDLLQDAHVVVRNYELLFEVNGVDRATETEHKVFTILDARGAAHSEIAFYYSELFKIDDIEARVYDANGVKIKELKRKDIEDRKQVEMAVSDARYKLLKLPASAYPYTIEYKVVSHTVGTFFFPQFTPQTSPDQSVEKARFEVRSAMPIRAKEFALPQGVRKGNQVWEFAQMKAFKPEAYAPLANMRMPGIYTAPSQFSFGGISGDMSTWESLGRFLGKLNEGRQELPPATLAKLRNLVADCPDSRCKTELIYKYLQEHTRYFNVSIGIGGWQPATATDVDAYKYGDCKGLSNYTIAMLKAVGVTAYPVIINASPELQALQFSDFPNAHFNHMMVCVPDARDTIWLECTSQSLQFGYLSDFTDARLALVVTPDGGRLWKTSSYSPDQNKSIRQTSVRLGADGAATVQTSERASCQMQDRLLSLADLSEEEQKKLLYHYLKLKDFEISSIKTQKEVDSLATSTQSLELVMPNYATRSGKRLFLPATIPFHAVEIPEEMPNRAFEVQADPRGYTEIDIMKIQVPEGYSIENALEPIELKTEFGQYSLSHEVAPDGITIKRSLQINPSVQPKEAYQTLRNFMLAITKADKTKLVLVNRT